MCFIETSSVRPLWTHLFLKGLHSHEKIEKINFISYFKIFLKNRLQVAQFQKKSSLHGCGSAIKTTNHLPISYERFSHDYVVSEAAIHFFKRQLFFLLLYWKKEREFDKMLTSEFSRSRLRLDLLSSSGRAANRILYETDSQNSTIKSYSYFHFLPKIKF